MSEAFPDPDRVQTARLFAQLLGRYLRSLPGLLISDLESVFLLHDSGGDRFVRRSAGAVCCALRALVKLVLVLSVSVLSQRHVQTGDFGIQL